MAEYRLTVGLEVHAELKTQTKMFCACLNDPDEKTPNLNICPVCMAHPGTLPVINKDAVHKVLLMGTAVGGNLADFTEFDRKNYFYPDIPKGYQISQYQYPLVSGGNLAGVELTRIHLEEDTARSQHEGEKSLVDYNRAGVPLMELVTEPVIHDAETAGRFARELQLLLRTLGAGEANMEKGEMRVEANISISSDENLGTKVEVKNLNSFRSVERAIAFEAKRQAQLLERGEKVVQETRGWDEAKQETFSQRKKESSHDYRYFPDPDLPKLKLSELPEYSLETLKRELPELPWAKRERYVAEGINPEYAEMFVADERLGNLFEKASALAPEAKKLLANYIGSDIVGLAAKAGEAGLAHITPEGLSALMAMLSKNDISSRGAKDAIADVFANGGDLAEVSKKYIQQSDAGALEAVAQKIIDAYPQVAADYKAGKTASLQFLIGQGMKETKGAGNPGVLREVFIKILG
ncbi:MAG TPA: Asp-tRNA(Asn)/Glu-tRNA(Gln) amidotransferase subunit GatB [Candidatus Paceibacterota bacterium]|nr:Asp-tRNA(Asn)/Glu-tRNA(Gln) amidotransferase subunit GatB [Candidatus Paceibacterota bacterium]